MKTRLKYISLKNVLDGSMFTQTTVDLFNSVRPILKDAKGSYIEFAVKAHLLGVLVEKRYL